MVEEEAKMDFGVGVGTESCHDCRTQQQSRRMLLRTRQPRKPVMLNFRTPFLLLVLSVSLSGWISIVQSAKFGDFECKVGKRVISKGDFLDSSFAPFISPQQEAADNCKGMYYSDMTCKFKFEAPANHLVYVEFVTMTLDKMCAKDFVTLDLGHSHRTLCERGQGMIYDISDEKRMEVSFKTDTWHSCQGFAAYFIAVLDSNSRKRRSVPSDFEETNSTSGVSHEHMRFARWAGSRKPKKNKKNKKKKRNFREQLSLYAFTKAYRIRNAVALTSCRQRLLDQLWQHDYCDICKMTEQIGNCQCYRQKKKKKLRARYGRSTSDEGAVNCGCR